MGLSAQEEMRQRQAEIGLIPERAALESKTIGLESGILPERYGLESTQIGTRQALAAGEGGPGSAGMLGTPYGSTLEMEELLAQTGGYLQERGLFRSGLLPELGVKAAARIAERNQQRQREEEMWKLSKGLERN